MTPKIIHFLWLNFNNKADGNLDTTLNFFKDRIETLHPTDKGWKINFISNWEQCLESIKSEKWLLELLNNDYVGPAHKSDALRYYYLYTMGGVWVDLSTFLVTSFDNLVEQNKEGFTCYYMPSNVCASWLIKLSSEIFESITMRTYKNSIIPIQNKLISIRDKNFDFITENYFMIFSKNNAICEDVLHQLRSFWSSTLQKINSKEDYCNELNMLMYDLFKKAYNMTIPYLDLLDLEIGVDTKYIILKEYFDCAYFFNYLQLYLAVCNYSNKNKGELKNISNSTEKNNTILLPDLSSFSKELCDSNSCNNKVITFTDTNKNINLLSASYNRLSKWSDDRSKRISWENTLAGDILKTENPNEVLRMLQEIEIYQLKYSSYTRSKSASIERLKELFTSYSVTPEQIGKKTYSAKKSLGKKLEAESNKALGQGIKRKKSTKKKRKPKRKKTKNKKKKPKRKTKQSNN
jgi:hypothetical protein